MSIPSSVLAAGWIPFVVVIVVRKAFFQWKRMGGVWFICEKTTQAIYLILTLMTLLLSVPSHYTLHAMWFICVIAAHPYFRAISSGTEKPRAAQN